MDDLESDLKEPFINNGKSIEQIHSLLSDFNKEYSILESKGAIDQNDVKNINEISKKIEELIKIIRSYSYDENVLDELRTIHVQVYNKMGVIKTRLSEKNKNNLNYLKEIEKINKLPILKKLSFTLGEKIDFEEDDDKLYHSLEDSETSFQQFGIPKCETIMMEQTATSTEAPSPQMRENNSIINRNHVIFTVLMISLFIGLVFYVYWI